MCKSLQKLFFPLLLLGTALGAVTFTATPKHSEKLWHNLEAQFLELEQELESVKSNLAKVDQLKVQLYTEHIKRLQALKAECQQIIETSATELNKKYTKLNYPLTRKTQYEIFQPVTDLYAQSHCTLNTSQYTFLPSNQNSTVFEFRVRAQNDAYIGLFNYPHNGVPLFQVILGGKDNQYSFISNEEVDKVTRYTPDILHPCQYRGFWIEWSDNVIRVGHEGQRAAFMTHYADYLYPVNNIAIHTGNGSIGDWLV